MTRACATCQNTRKVARPCDDPLCGDSTWDHACTAGSDSCPDCKSPPLEKAESLRLKLRTLAAAITTAVLVPFTKWGSTAALSRRHLGFLLIPVSPPTGGMQAGCPTTPTLVNLSAIIAVRWLPDPHNGELLQLDLDQGQTLRVRGSAATALWAELVRGSAR